MSANKSKNTVKTNKRTGEKATATGNRRKKPQKAATRNPETGSKGKTAAKRRISPEEKYQMIQTAAYYRAQRKGFRGDAMQHWIDAEKEIASRLEK